MKQRVISGAIVAAVIILTLYFGGPLFYGVISLIGLYGSYEYIKAIKKDFNYLTYLILLVTIFSLIFLHQYSEIIILLELIILLTIGIFDARENYVDLAGIFLFSILFGYALYYLIQVEFLNKYMLGYLFIISTFTDVFAYFVGRKFGKHKLNERVSPKKTIEGLIGGCLFGFAGSLIWAMIFKCFGYPTYVFVITSIILPFISEIGDLAFSLIKRHYEIKDFSNLIPGHGGILDRLDSIIFCIIGFGVLINLFS